MKPTYLELTDEITGNKTIQRINEDGSISSIPVDESNSDYQAYLNKATLASELVDPAPSEKPKK